MNEDFLKMQKLAGLITESQFKNKINEMSSPNDYQRVLDLYINSQDADDFFDDTHKKEIAAYLNSLKNLYPRVKSVEELASIIKEIDDRMIEITDDSSEDLFDEEVMPRLEEIAFDNPHLKDVVDEVLVALNKLYGMDNDEDDEDDDEFGHYDNPQQGWNLDNSDR